MWTSTRFTDKIGCRYPIVQGPMGGGHSTPALVAAAANAGALGSLGVYHLEPAAIVAKAAEIRRLTDRPFALNLWIPRTFEDAVDGPDEARRALDLLAPYRAELGLPPLEAAPPSASRDFAAQLAAILEIGPPVLSIIFGVLSSEQMAAVQERGITVIGTATTVDEARALEASGVDFVCASGAEAGGHRGSFLKPVEPTSLLGTMALVPQVASAVRVPVIAAGGIADGRGVAAALALGAAAAQIGTAFLMTEESGAGPLHRAALADPARAGRTVLTRAFSGRLVRAIANRFTDELSAHQAELLPFPLQGPAGQDIRQAAGDAGRDELLALYSGQSAPLAHPRPAADLVASLVAETEAVFARFRE